MITLKDDEKITDRYGTDVKEIVENVNERIINKSYGKKDINKMKRIFLIDEVPLYLRHNVFILSGYRGILNTKLCMERYYHNY